MSNPQPSSHRQPTRREPLRLGAAGALAGLAAPASAHGRKSSAKGH